MPEGPSIVILKEAVQAFKGKKIVLAEGNSKQIDPEKLSGLTIIDFKSWGKNFLICFPDFTVRIHFMLFGTYRINEHKPTVPRLSLKFSDNEVLNFYTCSIKIIEQPLDEIYDWSADVMNESWDPATAKRKLKSLPETLVCDALLDQEIFAGVGNIIKNEVLYRTSIHPLSKLGSLPAKKVSELVNEAVQYSFDFLEWKKEFTLKKHWLAHTKKICSRDQALLEKAYTGKTRRRSFFCNVCQKLYA